MKALIFNSGLGKRLGDMTKNNPKCMVKLYNGESIFERQIRILSEFGIKDFIITTGPFEEQLKEVASKFSDLNFTFVRNELYESTNYIVSMDKVKNYLDDDVLVLHGDLVFSKSLVDKVLKSEFNNTCLINKEKELPEKDFKGKIINNKLNKVAIDIFNEDCYAFQPFYKLDKETIKIWLDKVNEFVNNGITNVYAENALNEVTDNIDITPISYHDVYIEEIDNIDDYNKVNKEIREFDLREQDIRFDSIINIAKILKKKDNIFVIVDSFLKDKIISILEGYNYTLFTDYTPNPKYEDIKKGLEIFRKSNYNIILSLGGGSSIDVSKCIKAFSNISSELDFLENKYNYNNIKLISIPTTAGTGSESTSFAVMYYNDKKYSIATDLILPNLVILDKDLLESLPLYQKKSALMDALCQAIESYWSKSSNEESKRYSKEAIKIILNNYKEYLLNNKETFNDILKASNLSGKAINITKTTLPHAMSYKLTSLYNIAHGHAVFACLPYVWEYMYNDNIDNELNNTFIEIANIMGKGNVIDAIKLLKDLYLELELNNFNIKEEDIDILTNSVNAERLNNNPIIYNNEQIKDIYIRIKNRS